MQAGHITMKLVADKAKAVLRPGHPPEPLDRTRRGAPVLSDALALALARAARAISDSSRACVRVEILVLSPEGGRERPLVWQIERDARPRARAIFSVAVAERVPPENRSRVFEGRAIRIDDFAGLVALEERWPGEDALVVLDLSRFGPRDRERAVEVARRLAALGAPTAIQTSPLSHIALRLHEAGVRFWPIAEVPGDVTTGTLTRVVADAPALTRQPRSAA
jgi:hypothetical protein